MPLLDVRGLTKTFPVEQGFTRAKLHILTDVSFTVSRGEVVALVGESGSGKSTIARLLLRLMPADSGEIRLDGRDVLQSERGEASLAYRRRVQMIFQDPFGSLNPVHSVAHHLERPLRIHGRDQGPGRPAPGSERTPLTLRDRVVALLESVGLEPARELADAYPHALSGGQRQRVAIARALAVEPDLIIADEPTSMLDVSVRVGVLNLLARFKRELGVSYLLITHDLASARYLGDRILVLYAGRIVESAAAETLVAAPKHPYTKGLLAAVPRPGDDLDKPSAIRPGAPMLREPPPGCAFAARCPAALDVCRRLPPPAVTVASGHVVSCHLYAEPAVTGRGKSHESAPLPN